MTLLTTTQVASGLQVSEKYVLAQVKLGELRALKVGRTWRFQQTDVDTWVERRLT